MNLFLKRISIVAILIITATTSTLGQTQLPKGAKLKTIEYKSVDYLAVGYIEKNLFVENQTLTFFTKETQDTIISGKYYTKNNISYIDGFWKQPTEKGITRANGIFKIANNDVNGLTTKSKEAKILSVTIEDISYYQGFRNKYPARLEKQRNGEYFLTVKYTDRNGDNDLVKLELKVDKSLINQYGFLAIDDFIFYTTSVVMTQGNGTTFTGKVENTKDENNESTIKFLNNIEKHIKTTLKKNHFNPIYLFNEKVHLDSSRFGRPHFHTNKDKFFSGLTIMVNDTWAYEIFVSDFESKGENNHQIKLKIILYDHFGLDIPDVQNNLYYSFAGFRAWFVLQHYHSYKPFITKIEFEKTFKV